LFEINVKIASRARMNSDGTDVRRLTSDAADDVWPRLSPNGKQITFHSDVGGGDFERYTVNAGGTDLTGVHNPPRC
jgi:Tol biopolymer transport system component